jgi:hypothetical protein
MCWTYLNAGTGGAVNMVINFWVSRNVGPAEEQVAI